MLLQGQWRNEVNKHNLIECPFLIHRDTPARSVAVVHERPRNAAALDSVARGELLVRRVPDEINDRRWLERHRRVLHSLEKVAVPFLIETTPYNVCMHLVIYTNHPCPPLPTPPLLGRHDGMPYLVEGDGARDAEVRLLGIRTHAFHCLTT